MDGERPAFLPESDPVERLMATTGVSASLARDWLGLDQQGRPTDPDFPRGADLCRAVLAGTVDYHLLPELPEA